MRIALLSTALATFAAVFVASGDARADLSSCGNINVDASANCQLVTSGGCTAQCTPPNFQLACQGQLSASCGGSCSVTATADCNTSCSGSCSTACTANPGTFSCSGNCKADCSASCSGSCSSNANSTQCMGECQANCSTSCEAKCTGTLPSASCETQCSASCSGSCTAQANASCNISCQAQGEASCESSLTGGCQTQCSQPNGALFCNGQYVDTGNNLQNCLDALKNEFNITATASASGSCTGNDCSGQAAASAKCALAPNDPLTGLGLFAGVGAVIFAMSRRRRAD